MRDRPLHLFYCSHHFYLIRFSSIVSVRGGRREVAEVISTEAFIVVTVTENREGRRLDKHLCDCCHTGLI